MKIFFTELARNDLISVQDYIFNHNREAAKKVVMHIIEKIKDVLAINPEAGRRGKVLRTRELVIVKYPYIVSYRIKNNSIQILRILHTSKKWELNSSES